MRSGLIALLLLLAACGGPPAVFRSDRSDPLLTAPPLLARAAGGVWVGPIAGEDALPFRGAVAAALVERNVPAGLAPPGDRALRLAATPGRARAEARGYVDVVWRLTDAAGAVIDGFTVPTPLDFRIERPETQQAIAAVADRIAATLGPPKVAAAAAATFAVVPATTEGFEDGQPLARAMTLALAQAGFAPTAPASAAAIVRPAARVEIVEGEPDVRFVRIRWTVVRRGGGEAGAVDQENFAPEPLTRAGLAGLAADAAAAAVESVAGLIRLAAKRPGPSTGKDAS